MLAPDSSEVLVKHIKVSLMSLLLPMLVLPFPTHPVPPSPHVPLPNPTQPSPVFLSCLTSRTWLPAHPKTCSAMAATVFDLVLTTWLSTHALSLRLSAVIS